MSNDRTKLFFDTIKHPATVRRALVVSLIVGTILITINQLDYILSGDMPPVWKILLTYFTPYAVSSYSAAAAAGRV
jgi:hypothetical protein